MAISVQHRAGKGRGLVTTSLVHGGETVLSEAPILLTVSEDYKDTACCNCLAPVPPAACGLSCANCQQVAFCTTACQQEAAAAAWVHAPATCRAYTALPRAGDPEAAASLRFLIQAAALRAVAAAAGDARYGQLLELQGVAEEAGAAQAAALHALLVSATGDASISPQEVAALLRRERVNSFGVMAPPGPGGERRVRGGALYPTAAFINHECAPNAARFDGFDVPAAAPPAGSASLSGGGATGVAGGATAVHIRAMHDLPPGTEVTLSYVPLNWDYATRQEHLQQVYGFTCRCPRCLTEASPEWAAAMADAASSEGEWDTDEGDVSEEAQQASDDSMEAEPCGGGGGGGSSGSDTAARAPAATEAAGLAQTGEGTGVEEPLEPTYLQLFLLKYLCPREGCFGTLAPLAPGVQVYECNVCGGRRTEAEFLADLER